MRFFLGLLSLIWKLYIGIIFLITAIFYYPIITPFLFSLKGKRRAFRVFVAWSWTFRLLCLYHVRKVESNTIPDGPSIILANHISYLDIFLLYSFMNKSPFLFLGKSEILKYPLIKTYFKHMNIPVYRGTNRKAAKSLVQAMKEIRVGWSIVIFPEGGIPGHENPKMLDFKGGAFQLAKSMKIPIVPITYLNNHKLFSDPTKILGLASPGISKVVIHPTISVEEIEGLTQTELKAKCHKIINEPLKRMYPELID